MLESLELVFVMAAVGVPFYLYISITHFFHQKAERTARAAKLALDSHESTIAAMETELVALRLRLREVESETAGKAADRISSLSNARAA